MEAFLVSTLVVAVAEIGDKTQLLALVLASRYRRPAAIIGGILIATVANHALAAWLGAAVVDWLSPEVTRWALGLSFLGMAAWMLVPDSIDEEETPRTRRHGPFVTTTVAFFLVEIGDKTQVATVALAAQFETVLLVTAGTTLGMLAANVPAVLIGDRAATAVPMGVVRAVSALAFAVLGMVALLDPGLERWL